MGSIPEWVWVAWLAVAVGGGFAAFEGWAIANGEPADQPGDTLSSYVRKWLGVHPPRPKRRQIVVPLFIAGLIGLVGWLIPHFLMPPI